MNNPAPSLQVEGDSDRAEGSKAEIPRSNSTLVFRDVRVASWPKLFRKRRRQYAILPESPGEILERLECDFVEDFGYDHVSSGGQLKPVDLYVPGNDESSPPFAPTFVHPDVCGVWWVISKVRLRSYSETYEKETARGSMLTGLPFPGIQSVPSESHSVSLFKMGIGRR